MSGEPTPGHAGPYQIKACHPSRGTRKRLRSLGSQPLSSHVPASADRSRTPRGRRDGRPAGSVLGEGVLDLVSGLLEVRLDLVALALVLQLLVAGQLADAFLDLAADLFALVVGLVANSHGQHLPSLVVPTHPRCPTNRRANMLPS